MSSAARWCVCFMVGVGLLPTAAFGQEAEVTPTLFGSEGVDARQARRAELEGMLATMRPAIERAKAEADAADERRRLDANERVSALDTLRLGPVTVVARENRSAEAERVLRRVLEWYQQPLAGHAAFAAYMAYEVGPYAGRLGVDEPHMVWRKEDAPVREMERAAAGALANLLRDQMPSRLREWLGTGAPVDPAAGDQRKLIYREMVTARSQSVKACLADDIARCWQAIGVVPGTADPGRIWYSDAERQQFAIDWSFGRAIGRIENLAECEGGDMDACDRVLERVSPWPVEPLRAQGRVNLMSFALERGGAGSFLRMVSTEGTVADKLAAAANLSPETLMTEWLQFLRQDFSPRGASVAGTLATMLLWVGLLTFVGTASTRWRFS